MLAKVERRQHPEGLSRKTEGIERLPTSTKIKNVNVSSSRSTEGQHPSGITRCP